MGDSIKQNSEEEQYQVEVISHALSKEDTTKMAPVLVVKDLRNGMEAEIAFAGFVGGHVYTEYPIGTIIEDLQVVYVNECGRAIVKQAPTYQSV